MGYMACSVAPGVKQGQTHSGNGVIVQKRAGSAPFQRNGYLGGWDGLQPKLICFSSMVHSEHARQVVAEEQLFYDRCDWLLQSAVLWCVS